MNIFYAFAIGYALGLLTLALVVAGRSSEAAAWPTPRPENLKGYQPRPTPRGVKLEPPPGGSAVVPAKPKPKRIRGTYSKPKPRYQRPRTP